MARTNWGMVILGGGLLVGGAYVFLNWKTVCPKIMSADKCTGETPIDSILEYNQLPTALQNPTTNQYRSTTASKPNTRVVTPTYTYGNSPKNVASGKAGTKVAAPTAYVKPANTTARKNDFCSTGNNKKLYPNICGFYTNTSYYGDGTFNSFNTFTLNRVSVR